MNEDASYRQTIFRVISFHIGGGNNRVAYDVAAQLFAGFHNNRFNYSARVQVRQVLDDQIAVVNINLTPAKPLMLFEGGCVLVVFRVKMFFSLELGQSVVSPMYCLLHVVTSL